MIWICIGGDLIAPQRLPGDKIGARLRIANRLRDYRVSENRTVTETSTSDAAISAGDGGKVAPRIIPSLPPSRLAEPVLAANGRFRTRPKGARRTRLTT